MDARELLRRVLAVCGPGRLLVDGPRAAEVVAEARKAGVDALPLPAKGRAPGAQTVLLTGALGAMAADAARAALARAASAAGRNVVLAASDAGEDPATPRGEWERLAFALGLRRHPLFLLASPYPDLEYERAFVAALEKVPAPALARWPLEALARERDLHMDMLREAGRRSDAHAERYRLAMAFARRGDAALDAACGLGYGSRLLFEGSGVARVTGVDVDAGAVAYAAQCYGIPGRVEYRQADATDLSFLGPHSVDFVASFETLEHLLEPERFLAEVARVLRPAGRLVVSVPNRWVDETGRDPNPHHHHVYDWARLRGELARHFLVERAFVQTAGGGMVHAGRPRALAEFAPEGEAPEGEWILAVAMQDPAKGRGVPYEETVHAGYGGKGTPVVVDFGRAYANPWLVRGMVNTGTRLAHRGALLDLAGRVAADAPAGSVDAGAALCVALYGALERGEAGAIAAAADRARQWRAAAGDGPHALRWRVSLLHVEGLAALAAGDRAAARRLFAECAATDVSPFSPLLATKRVASAWIAGLLDAQAGDAKAAAAAWREGLAACREAFAGDWAAAVGRPEAPLEFALPEFGDLATLASRCAYAINALPDLALRPGWFWQETSRDLATQAEHHVRTLAWAARQIAGHREALERASEEAERASEEAQRAREEAERWRREAAEAGRQAAQASRLAETLAATREGAKWLESQRDALARELDGARAGAKWLESQRDAWERTAAERGAAIAGLEGRVAALAGELEGAREGAKWLESQREAWQKASAEREAAIAALEAQAAALARDLEATREGARWLQSQRDAWQKAATEREDEIAALSLDKARLAEELAATREGAKWLESQRDAWSETARAHERAAIDHRTEAMRLAQRVDELEARAAELDRLLARARGDLDAFARQGAVRFATALRLAKPPPPEG